MENYFKLHSGYKDAIKSKNSIFYGSYLQYNKDLGKYVNVMKDSKILEIGCGMGKFAYFCDKIGVKDYIGIDIDDYFFNENKKDFPKYEFRKISFQEYLKEHKNEFDFVFTSHVFEHLDEKERVEMIIDIHSGLRKGGIWINYMPNANDSLSLGTIRYGDITHKTVYTENSFAQVVYSTNVDFDIENRNLYVGTKNKFRRFIHLCFLFFTKIYYIGMGGKFPEIYTREFINILRKK